MPRDSYDLPGLDSFASKKRMNGQENSLREGQTEVITVQPEILDCSTAAETREWKDSICDCGNDLKHCALTTFFPMCMLCHEYKIQGEGCAAPMCPLVGVFPLTTQYRARQGIQGKIWKDCLMSTFCWQCQLCRLHRDFVANDKGNTDLIRGNSSLNQVTSVGTDGDDNDDNTESAF